MALKLLDSVAIDHAGSDTRTLMLCQGDLSQLAPADAVDFICVSALPGDYSPTPGSLIGALAQAGVSVQQQAQNKAADYEPTMPCWISQDVGSAGLNFRRFVLFEPPQPIATNAPLDVDMIFRALGCFVGNGATSIALPMVSTGSGGADFATIVRQLFYAAAHWGSLYAWPLGTIKLVAYSDAQATQAQQLFAAMKTVYQNPPLAPPSYAGKLPAAGAPTAIPATMTQRQYNCVRAYTGNAIYAGINAALRENSLTTNNFIYWQPTIEAISSGLANLPNYVGLTQRGTTLPQSVIDQYKVGAIITHYAFTSSSRDRPWSGNTLLNITSVQGKDVEALSYYPQEHEVLYDARMTDQVTAVSGPSGGYQYVFASTQYVPNWCGV